MRQSAAIPDRLEWTIDRSSSPITWMGKDTRIQIRFIQPCKPTQNRFVERFNRMYREDILDAYLFNSLDEARRIAAKWLEEYNSIRLHESIWNYEFSAKPEVPIYAWY